MFFKVKNSVTILIGDSMNNKGFTMVEVLATFVLMGIILGIAFPAIDSLYQDSSKQTYETYEMALKTAAKLYVDQYDRDLWTYSTDSSVENETCVKLEFKDIRCEGLIKDFEGKNKNYVVDENNTYVYAIKKGNKVRYETYLVIKREDTNDVVYPKEEKEPTTACSVSRLKGICNHR